MGTRSVVLIGGPDTGKTNFIGRLWIALQSGEGALVTSGIPEQIEYVEQVVEHLHRGEFAPRTDRNMEVSKGRVIIPIACEDTADDGISELVVPDVSGEIRKKAVVTRELAPEWMSQLENAVGALLFVRAHSPLNVNPPDWVTTARLLNHQGELAQPGKMPTQVMLCEFLRFLELTMSGRSVNRKRKIAVVVTAWDLLNEEDSSGGPRAYLQSEYPLFFGRLGDLDGFEVMVFAVSVVGGDLKGDKGFHEEFLNSDRRSFGFVQDDADGETTNHDDMTLPVAWALGARCAP